MIESATCKMTYAICRFKSDDFMSCLYIRIGVHEWNYDMRVFMWSVM